MTSNGPGTSRFCCGNEVRCNSEYPCDMLPLLMISIAIIFLFDSLIFLSFSFRASNNIGDVGLRRKIFYDRKGNI